MNKTTSISVICLALCVGYFAGREHLKYEIRSTFNAAMQDASKHFEEGMKKAFTVTPEQKAADKKFRDDMKKVDEAFSKLSANIETQLRAIQKEAESINRP